MSGNARETLQVLLGFRELQLRRLYHGEVLGRSTPVGSHVINVHRARSHAGMSRAVLVKTGDKRNSN